MTAETLEQKILVACSGSLGTAICHVQPPDLIRGEETVLQKRAFQKLAMLDASETVDDLRIPPSNNLETLSGDRKGQWSIRINHKYRICFTWTDHETNNVEIVEYH